MNPLADVNSRSSNCVIHDSTSERKGFELTSHDVTSSLLFNLASASWIRAQLGDPVHFFSTRLLFGLCVPVLSLLLTSFLLFPLPLDFGAGQALVPRYLAADAVLVRACIACEDRVVFRTFMNLAA